ncbi:hypothetical protein C1645_840435 [Glomus cerebriforme]|uniref:Uncharacterized protein n=1 Tax=Glomus cerebriforme TaxID=658196 RepID=A0A397RZA2_9GLOM|nr:hypothetical protein C1645_840435 [Glomus cerebriforme]
MGGGSSNGSSPIGSLSSSVQNEKGKRFSKLFGPEWEGKMVLCAFGSILELETYMKLKNDSPSHQEVLELLNTLYTVAQYPYINTT